jgi:hypothetical protein
MTPKKIFIELFGGEQDGWNHEITYDTPQWPELFYVYRARDEKRIKEAVKADFDLGKLLNESLSVLAYEFKAVECREGVAGGKVYCYLRTEEADKALSDPAV